MKRAERLSAIGHLSAGLAHEVRNPLASIAGAASILRRNQPQDQSWYDVPRHHRERVPAVEWLLTNFLNFARPRSPSFQPVEHRSAFSNDVIALAEHAVGRKRSIVRKTE